MRIITWNIRLGNKRAAKLISHALSYSPDVLCLQEISERNLVWLKKQHAGFVVNISYDFTHPNPQKNGYVCTLTREEPVSTNEIIYDHLPDRSFLSKFYYRKIRHQTERHTALVLTVRSSVGDVRIVNMRLSCAVGTLDRVKEFEQIIERLPPLQGPTILCGDLNVNDSPVFRRVTGWIRGFTAKDYRIDEREAFERMYESAHLNNVFRGQSTMFFRKPLLQLDHILLPDSLPSKSAIIGKKLFGSDHRMLLVDI